MTRDDLAIQIPFHVGGTLASGMFLGITQKQFVSAITEKGAETMLVDMISSLSVAVKKGAIPRQFEIDFCECMQKNREFCLTTMQKTIDFLNMIENKYE